MRLKKIRMSNSHSKADTLTECHFTNRFLKHKTHSRLSSGLFYT